MSNRESIIVMRLLGLIVFSSILGLSASGQMSFTDQAGGFGPFGGYVISTLKQPGLDGSATDRSLYRKGFEVGIKSEMYRFRYLRGNIMASYIRLGAHEYLPGENNLQDVEVDLQAFKAAFNPFLFKVGNDFLHGYAGGGGYGTFYINQEVSAQQPLENYWNGEQELRKFDYGLDLVAGVHVWNFDIEFHAQLGMADLGERFDNTLAKQQFFSITLAYLYVNQHVTVKSCKNKKSLRKVY